MSKGNTNTTPEETQNRVVSSRAVHKGRKEIEKKAQRLEKLQVQYFRIDEVKPNSYNPNRQSDHDFELLLRSMEEDGFTQPIVVTNDLTIVDGEHRWRAAATLGFTEIPCVVTDMTLEQAMISTLRHNRARGSHDIELEADVLRDLRELGALDWAQDSLMLDDVELQRMLEDVNAPEVFANKEFSQAWVPGEKGESETVSDDGTARTSTSVEAIEALRKQEERLKEAKTEEERKMVKKDTDIYRLSLIFTGDQAKTIRDGLGDKPAETILNWCSAKIGAKAD